MRRAMVTVVVGLAVIACGPGPSTGPSASPPPAATSISIPSTAPTSPPTTAPSAAVPADTPTASSACTSLPQTGLVASDRLTDVDMTHLPGRDVVRFVFGEGSLTPAGPSTGTLDIASPPFTEAGSGSQIDLHGERALQVVFKGMSLQNDIGEPTYTGQRDIEVVGTSPIVRQAVIFDESEGQIGWYIGYDGSGCITLAREGSDVLLTIAAG